jgi:hypothetical protein
MRGSSDLANYQDGVLSLSMNGERLILKQLKNRSMKKEKPISIDYNLDDVKCSAKFSFGGSFIKVTVPERCAEVLIVWFSKEKVRAFKTSEAVHRGSLDKFNKTSVERAIKLLQERGIIESIDKGHYKVNPFSF